MENIVKKNIYTSIYCNYRKRLYSIHCRPFTGCRWVPYRNYGILLGQTFGEQLFDGRGFDKLELSQLQLVKNVQVHSLLHNQVDDYFFSKIKFKIHSWLGLKKCYVLFYMLFKCLWFVLLRGRRGGGGVKLLFFINTLPIFNIVVITEYNMYSHGLALQKIIPSILSPKYFWNLLLTNNLLVRFVLSK